MHTMTLSQGLFVAMSLCALVSCDSQDAAQKELMEKGVISSVLDVGSPVGRNALCQAIIQDNMEITERLLEAGVSPDAKAPGEDGLTPVLVMAVMKRNEDLARMLLRYGANVNAQDTKGDTALMCAAFAGQLDMVELLLDNKADANIKNDSQWTALMAACAKSGRISDWPGSPDSRFAILPSPQSDPKAQRAIVQALLNAGAKSTCDKHGWTPVAIAACEGRPQMVKLLESLPTEYDDANVRPIPPLMAAAWAGEAKTVAHLIKSGADVNGGVHHDTPLCCAARQGHAEIIAALCKAGAAPNLCNGRETPLSCAARFSHTDCVECLLDHGAEPKDEKALEAAITNFDTATIQALLDAGADIKTLSQPGTLLKRVVSYMNPPRFTQKPADDAKLPTMKEKMQMLDTLIAAGIRVNDSPEKIGDTLLHLVLNSYLKFDTDTRLKLAEKILKAGVDINYADKDGETILTDFIKFHKTGSDEEIPLENVMSVVDFLLKSGADPNTKLKGGDTPLHLVLSRGWCPAEERPQITQALIKAGADVNKYNKIGETPLYSLVSHLVTETDPKQRKSSLESINILLSAGANPNARNEIMPPLLHVMIKATLLNADTRLELMETLIRGGADVNARDSMKSTPLHTLIEESHLYEEEDLAKMAKLLMSARPDLTIKDYRGKTVLEELNNPYGGRDEKKARLKRIIK